MDDGWGGVWRVSQRRSKAGDSIPGTMATPEPAYKIGAFLIEHVRAWGWAIVGWFSRDAQRNRQFARMLDWLGRIRRVDEATNQSAVRRSHTAGIRPRGGRLGLPKLRSSLQPPTSAVYLVSCRSAA